MDNNFVQFLKNIARPVYYGIIIYYDYLLEYLFPPKIVDFKAIPIIINNFNRLTYLKALIEALERMGYRNIYIIDNASTYAPLLQYYDNIPYTVFRLKENIGYLALWKTSIYKKFINDYYIYTDSDVVPVEDCPHDFAEVFVNVLRKYKFAKKVGFALKLDDLPESYHLKSEVIKWESQFYNQQIEPLIFKAPIDTTFALYRPRAKGGRNDNFLNFRTASPYIARHMPWYIDSNNLDKEELFYIKHCKTSTHWTSLNTPK
jgi:hypothetical protein